MRTPAERASKADGSFVVTLPRGREYRSPVLTGVRLDLEALWMRLDRRLALAG